MERGGQLRRSHILRLVGQFGNCPYHAPIVLNAIFIVS